MTVPEIASTYQEIQARLSGAVRGFSDEQLATPTPACPEWTVKGVISHLAANVDDVLAGRLAGPPDEAQTAAQVADRADVPIADILDRWDEQTPTFAALVADLEIWLVPFDLITHEFDVKGALGDRSNRTGDEISAFAARIGDGVDVGRPLRIETDTQVLGTEDADLSLRITDFELLRVRPGRRSADQVRALGWSEDIGDDALRICVFGPSPLDIVE